MTLPIDQRPFSQACEENKGPIQCVLIPLFAGARQLLEIGSGTGQHAVHFAAALAHLRWQASDVAAHLPGIRSWTGRAALANLPDPLQLDVRGDWPEHTFDAAFSANTAHIMSAGEAEAMFAGLGRVLAAGAPFALYGPFNYGGRYTSESNARFDAYLKSRDPASGIKDLEDIEAWAGSAGFSLEADHEMPVNNRTLVWRKHRT